MTAKMLEVPQSLNEEFYQMNMDIRQSFSKYRPPLNIYHFKEDVARIEPYFKVGNRLSNEQVEELDTLIKEGLAFVSRSDHPIYVKHIAHQLDLVLVDKNLKASEICDIFIQALTLRLEHLMEQPVKAIFERFLEDLRVLVEYLSEDMFRIKGLVKRLHKQHTLANHSVNCGVLGLALFLYQQSEDFAGGEFPKRSVESMALGLFLHDIGMTRIPSFVRDKANLTRDEQQKVTSHPNIGQEILTRLGIRGNEVERCAMEHHERLNGSGYPLRYKDTEISYPGKLCGLVDSFCAMVTERPYAKAMAPEEAAKQLAADETRYDPKSARLLQTLILTKKLTVEVRDNTPVATESDAAA